MITTLPPAPSRGDDSDVFVARADAHIAALPRLVAEINSLATIFNLSSSLATLGYLPPVLYGPGLSMTVATQTVQFSGNTYAPVLASLPFVTSGDFEFGSFRLIQGLTGAQMGAPTGAGLVGVSPAGDIAATNTQAALYELDAKKVPFSVLASPVGSSLVRGPDGRTLAEWLGKDGVFNGGVQRLPRWSAACARSRAGGRSSRAALPGDSTFSGVGSNPASATWDSRRRACPQRLAEILTASYGLKAHADSIWCDGFEGANLPLFDPRIKLEAGWVSSTTFVAGGYALIDRSTTSPKLTFNPGKVTDTLDLYFVKAPGHADVVISTDGVYNASTITAGPFGVGKLTAHRAASDKPWDIQKSTSTPSFDLMIAGVDAYFSTDHNVSIWNMGASGSKVSHWATGAEGYNFRNAIQVFAPDLTIINLCINDWSQGTSKASYQADMQVLISAALVTGDVLLVIGVPSNVGAASEATQAAFASYVYELAVLNKLMVLNLSYRWVSQAYLPEREFYFDGQHPSQYGYFDCAVALANVIGYP